MALTSGTRLGPYEILEPIGAGGMGEVYRARDTKLDRDVAIKVLPEEFAKDAERLARFEREAKLLASLNHPNIASIHGFEESDGVNALVLELVEGPTLAERIEQGPIPIGEAIPIAKQIAEALEAGHEAGVIHRDLKPANIKLKEDGTVKVLDYGLAKALEGETAGGADTELSQSPTLTRQGTQIGVILGTAAYMSPEQAKGKRVDKRADIWAFGAVVYEMLAGCRAFGGEDVPDTLASVLTKRPNWELLPEATPASVRNVLQFCLERDAKRRVRDAGDIHLLLDVSPDDAGSEPHEERAGRSVFWFVGVALAGAVLGAVGGGLGGGEDDIERSTVRFRIDTSRANAIGLGTFARSFAISPDGQVLVYAGASGAGAFSSRSGVSYRERTPLLKRRLDDWLVEPIVGTEGAQAPIFSPDGAWIAYFGAEGLTKVRLEGGRTVVLSPAGSSVGAHWSQDGWIYFQQYSKGIVRVRAEGGETEVVLAPNLEKGEKTTRHPHLLPDNRALLFTTGYSGMRSYDEATIEAYDFESGERQVLLEGAANPVYVEPGHLLFVRNRALMVVRFDADRVEVLSGPVTVVEDIFTSGNTGSAEFDVATNGTLASVRGTRAIHRVHWVGRDGALEPFDTEGRNIGLARFSPGGGRLALHEMTGSDPIWVHEIDRGTWVRVASGWDSVSPSWTPDGNKVIYTTIRPDGMFVTWNDADGSAAPERLFETSALSHSVTNDGDMVIYATGTNVVTFSLTERGLPESIYDGDGVISDLELSPNGSWVAFVSDASGRPEVYVAPFPDMTERYAISTSGGLAPQWSGDGRRLLFLNDKGISSASIRTEGEFRVSRPELTLELPNVLSFDIAPDDSRMIVVQDSADEMPVDIDIVLNWHEELERLVPTQ